MNRPRLLDLFCGAGGAAVGYRRAGFDVVGVDIDPQPNYPFEFVQADALDYLDCYMKRAVGLRYDAIHASPPCHDYSTSTGTQRKVDGPRGTAHLLPDTRERLAATGLPFVIENVEGARRAMAEPVRLCGSSFGLDLRRHRLFETNWPLTVPPCDHAWQTPRFTSLWWKARKIGQLASVVGVHGSEQYPGDYEERCRAMGIDWMTLLELNQAIPPDFTEHIGRQLMERL